LRTWQTSWNGGTAVTTQSQTVYDAPNHRRTVTVTAPDGTQTVTVYQEGRLQSVSQKNASGGQLSQTTYGYDTHGRQQTVTDARNGTTTYGYNDADQVTSVTTPAPGTGQAAQTTSTEYDELGRPKRIVYPDGASVTNEFWPTGEIKRTYGSRAFPVGYGYDDQGRLAKMTNWITFASAGERVTTWNYSPTRGWLDNKRYPDGTGPDYTYKASGRLWTRTWARGGPRIQTTYAYNNAGNLESVSYNEGTPTTSYTYDRRGRQSTITRNGIMTILSYNDANQLLSESYAGGTLAGLSVVSQYDSLLRHSQFQPKNGGTPLSTTTYGYNAQSGRLESVSDGTYSATYSYLANSPLISQITFKQNSTVRMTTSKQYDKLNRLLSISSAPSGTGILPVSFSY
jgi:YD repeat-containing protein